MYGVLTRLWRQKTMDIKLPMPISEAKTMFSFSTLRSLHHKKLFHQWLAFSGQHSKISWPFQHLIHDFSGPQKYEFQDFSVPVGILSFVHVLYSFKMCIHNKACAICKPVFLPFLQHDKCCCTGGNRGLLNYCNAVSNVSYQHLCVISKNFVKQFVTKRLSHSSQNY